MSTRKTTAMRPAGASGFNELDNWLEIMDIDPPHTVPEKRVMYERLLDILAKSLENPEEASQYQYPTKKQIRRDMRRIIER